MCRKLFFVGATVFFLSGCVVAANNNEGKSVASVDSRKLPISYALKGTSTAVVGIALDDKGYPLETVRAVVLKPGQRVVFAGPDEFQIAFKDKKAPDGKLNYRSEKGVVAVSIPKDIFDKPEYARELVKNKSLEFNYAIRVNGRELDPPIIVKREE